MVVRKASAGLLLVALLAACSPQRGIDAARVLGDIAAGEGPSRLKDATPAPSRAVVDYAVDGRAREGDLYRPGGGAPSAALVLVPGVAPAGKDDRRLVAFAHSLARAGFLVLVPEIAGLRALRVRASDADDIADAVRHLATRTQATEGGAVGLVAISYAAGPTLIAAAGDAGQHLRFVLAVGGYYDMTALITYVTTGSFRTGRDAPWQQGRPNEYGKWVFLESNAHHVEDARDRALLAAIAGRKRRDPAAEIGDLVERLGEDGRAVYALLDNRDPERVPRLIDALPDSVRREIVALDPSRLDLHRIGAQLLLVHGRDDPIIPWTESGALAEAVPDGRAELFLSDSLSHVDMTPGEFGDLFTLWRAVYRVLELRDDMPAPESGGR